MKTKKTLCLTSQELYEAVEKWLKGKGTVVKVEDINYKSSLIHGSSYEIDFEEDQP